MYIYKISNVINNKMYIGQSKYNIDKRFKRHVDDAMKFRINTHLAKAIRKYGKENFIIELIDSCETQDELNKKEHYWIHYYNTLINGYNETDSIERCGGNTYAGRTIEEMNITKNKLSESKSGAKNPNSRKVKCLNINTKQELHFDTNKEMQNYFNEKNHNFITRRCNNTIKCLYKKEWLIAYEENEYIKDYTVGKNNARAKRIKVKTLDNNIEFNFNSYAAAERFFNLPLKTFSGKAYKKGKHFIIKNQFDITVLN